VKKRRHSSADAKTTSRRRGRQMVQVGAVVLGAILLVDALVGEKGFLEILKARQQYRQLELSLLAARAENARLREEARRLREDPAAIEELARREHGLIRPGEKLFILRDLERPPQ
jgi:cell division protein FtsB